MKKLVSIIAIVVIIIIIVALAGKKDDAMPVLEDQMMNESDMTMEAEVMPVNEQPMTQDDMMMEAGVDTVVNTEATPIAE